MKNVFSAAIALSLLMALLGCAGGSDSVSDSTPSNCSSEVKNVIFIVGDGMGAAQIALLNELDADTNAFFLFPQTALVTTFSANNRVTDSAAGGTALFTGHKTNNSVLGMDSDSNDVENFAEKCSAAGLDCGIVTLCSFTHATPAAMYAHNVTRHDDEGIADDFLSSGLDVVFTGGSGLIAPDDDGDSPRLDSLKAMGYNVVLDDYDFIGSIPDEWNNIIFLPFKGHFPDTDQRRPGMLAECTQAALDILEKDNENGFLLMVEESQIDFSCHDHLTESLAKDMEEINSAMLVAKRFADTHPGTLVIVTADHETGGLSIVSNDSDFNKGDSGIDCRWSTDGHSGVFVPLFAYGPGAEEFHGLMDNTEVHRKVCELLGI